MPIDKENPTEEPKLEILLDTAQHPATFSLTQQRGVIVDEAGNQEFFWLKLTLPFTLNRPVAPDSESLTRLVQDKLAIPLGYLMLDLLAGHAHRTAAAVTPDDPPIPAMEPGQDELF